MIKVPPRVPIEMEMNRFVRSFGGQLVVDAVGSASPPFANADYWFERDNIVAELKCLSDDKTDDRGQQAAVQKLFDSFVDSGRMRSPGWGRFRVGSKNFPVEFQLALYRTLARPIKKRLAKANRQIKETRQKLGRTDAYGLVLLANDGNYRLEPAQFLAAVDVALGQDFSAIDGVVVFTVNLLSTAESFQQYASHANVWIPCSRAGRREIPDDFLHRLCEGWGAHVAEFLGEEIPTIPDVEHEELETLRYDHKISRARR